MKLFGRAKESASQGVQTQLPANLQDDNLKFKVIIDNIEEGVILIDSQQIIRLINPGASMLCGWPSDEAVNLDVNTVITLVNDKGDPLDDKVNPLKLIFQSDKSLRGENVFLQTRDKRQVAISLHVSPLLDSNRQVTAAIAVMSDISKEHAEEQQRADFISTASHEMRTPVAAIEGYLSLALNEKVATIDEQARGYLEKARSSTQHLGKLFQDLLTSAKAEDGRLTSHPTIVEVGEFLDNLSGDFRLVAEQKGLVVDFMGNSSNVIDTTAHTAGDKVVRPLFYVLVDPDRLREVLTNLFDNAVKYTDAGTVSIGLTGNESVVQCYVRDTGPGIPPEDIPHLFQKFYRVDNSSTRTIGGTGLGLFICRKIIELYNGRIWAESKLGEGSTFYINLPRLSQQKVNELQSGSSRLVKPSGANVTP
ncbi:MAG: sensor histidine kinase [Candidatus Saccharimonadales bacterium]